MLDQHEAEGYPCPRREWTNPDHPLTAELAGLGARPETGHLFRVLFDTACGGWTREEQLALIRRIHAAYADEVISVALWPPRH